MEVKIVFANVADGVERVAHRQGRTVEVLIHDLPTVSPVRRRPIHATRHIIGIPVGIKLQHVGKESVKRIAAIACLPAQVVNVALRSHSLRSEQTPFVAQEDVAPRIALTTYVVVIVRKIERQFRILVHFFQMVSRQHMRAVIERAFLRQS